MKHDSTTEISVDGQSKIKSVLLFCEQHEHDKDVIFDCGIHAGNSYG
jgi:hypothetical protein